MSQSLGASWMLGHHGARWRVWCQTSVIAYMRVVNGPCSRRPLLKDPLHRASSNYVHKVYLMRVPHRWRHGAQKLSHPRLHLPGYKRLVAPHSALGSVLAALTAGPGPLALPSTAV